MLGSATSVAEVTHVSRHGFWLLLGSGRRRHDPLAQKLLPARALPGATPDPRNSSKSARRTCCASSRTNRAPRSRRTALWTPP